MGALVGLGFGVGCLLVWSAFRAPRPTTVADPAAHRTGRLLAEAGLREVAPRSLAALCVGSGLVAVVVVLGLTRAMPIALVLGALAGYLPVAVVRGRARRRQREFAEVWPEAVDDLASAVRAGMSLPDAVAALAVRGPVPLRPSFDAFALDYQVSGRFGDCLDRLKDRLADPVGDRVVEGLRIAREVGGGELGRLLRNLSGYLRDDLRTRSELEAKAVTGYNELGLPTGTDLSLDVPDLRATYSTRATYTSTGLPATTTLAETRSATLNQGSYIERLRHWYTSLGLENGLTGTNVYLQNATYTPFREASQYVLGVNDATSALTYTRDPHHRWITNTQLTGQLAQPQIANVAASYDAVGNTTRTVDTQGGPGAATRTTCYQYDSLQQLTNAWTATDNCTNDPSDSVVGGPDPFWQTWSYDAAGSRDSQTIHTLPGQSGADAVTTYVNGVEGHEHALASTETSGETSPSAIGIIAQLPATSSATYTPNGATDTITTPAGDTAFKYRDDGTLATVTTDGATSEFVNDADGNRILRIDRKGGTTSTTLYLPGQQVRVTDTSGSKTLTTHRYYTLASGQQIAVRKNDVNPVFTLTDPHGTAQLTYDPFSNSINPPVERRALDPYGNELGSDSTPASWVDDRTFLGKPHNPATGLVDLGARQYDPATGRFASVDPLLNLADATQANGYNYANNNPITYTDPDGLASVCVREGTCNYTSNPKGGAPIVTGPKSSSSGTSTGGGNEVATSNSLDLLYRYNVIEKKSGNWLTSFGAGVAETTLWMGENLTPMAPIADIANLAGAPLPSDIWSDEMEARGVKGTAYTTGQIVGPPLFGFAGAATRLPRLLSRLPLFRSAPIVPTVVFSRGRAPGIANTFDTAVANGAPTRLNRVTAATRDANRRAALRDQSPAPAGQSLDEYPFACSAQGGCGSFVNPVAVAEQNYQGGVLSSFFRKYGIQPGDPFDVMFGP